MGGWQDTMVALGYLAQAAFGTNALVDGLACTPTSPASMALTVGPGMITSYTVIEPNAYGTLPADTVDPVVKMGINITGTSITFAAPTTPGQSINNLIYGKFAESDSGAVVLPYYNAANPSQAYNGPSNSGTAQNTIRDQSVTVSSLPGAPATTGTQTTPATPAGAVPLYVVTVAYGATTLTLSNISVAPGAPFIPAKLGPGFNPGFSRCLVYQTTTTLVVPNGVTSIHVRLVGGGGGGGGALNTGCSASGGAGGGYAEGIYTVTPGASIAITIGAAGTAGQTLGGNGGAGGTTSFGSVCSATGGGGGFGASSGVMLTTPAGGIGTGGNIINLTGIPGTAGFITGNTSLLMGGGGGANAMFPTITIGGVSGGGSTPVWPGTGGGGASTAAAGGAGAAGLVMIEY